MQKEQHSFKNAFLSVIRITKGSLLLKAKFNLRHHNVLFKVNNNNVEDELGNQ